MTIRSKPYYVLDVPVIEDISGTFKYHYFTKGESVYDGDFDPTNEEATSSRYGSPREVILEISDSIGDLSIEELITEEVAKSLLTAENLSKAESESLLQNENATRLTFNIQDKFLESIYNTPAFSSANDHYDGILNLIGAATPENKHIITSVIESASTPGVVEIDHTTNLPVVNLDEIKAKSKTTGIILDFALGDLVSSIVNDPASVFSDQFYEFENNGFEKQSDSRFPKPPGIFDLNDYYLSVELLSRVYVDTPVVAPFAFIVYKTRVEGTQRIPEEPLILYNRNKKTIIDTAVMYGQKYEYSIHTLVLVSAIEEDGKPVNFLLISKDSKKLEINCIEKNPPPAVNDINFRFLDSTMLLTWDLPMETSPSKIPVNDIKYVQIFQRTSIGLPFSLIQMYDFNDSILKLPLPENINQSLVKTTVRSDNQIELLLPGKGEQRIFAICLIDAHGNSSFLSAQFSIDLDNLNQPKINFVAFPGAPKQYPNLTLDNDVFVDSIRASGYKTMTFYHNPKYTVLLNGENTQQLVSTHTQTDIPSYIIQLIDVETQKDEKIEVFINQ